MTLENVLDYLDEIERECYREPKRDWPNYIYRQRCYERWAISELREKIIKEWKNGPLIEIAYELYFKWSDLMCEDTEMSINLYHILTVATETISDIMEWYL